MRDDVGDVVREFFSRFERGDRRIDAVGRYLGHNLSRLRRQHESLTDFVRTFSDVIGVHCPVPEDQKAMEAYVQGYLSCARDAAGAVKMHMEGEALRNPIILADRIEERPELVEALKYAVAHGSRGSRGFTLDEYADTLAGDSRETRLSDAWWRRIDPLIKYQLLLQIPARPANIFVIYGLGTGVAAILERRASR